MEALETGKELGNIMMQSNNIATLLVFVLLIILIFVIASIIKDKRELRRQIANEKNESKQLEIIDGVFKGFSKEINSLSGEIRTFTFKLMEFLETTKSGSEKNEKQNGIIIKDLKQIQKDIIEMKKDVREIKKSTYECRRVTKNEKG